jgi:uncharacterized protein (DUF1778 family)
MPDLANIKAGLDDVLDYVNSANLTGAKKAQVIQSYLSENKISVADAAAALGLTLSEFTLMLGSLEDAASPLSPPVRPLDLIEVRTGITTPASNVATINQGETMTVSDQDIKQFIDDILNGPGNDQQKAQRIIEAMRQYKVTSQRIAAATGYSLSDISQFLALASPSVVSPGVTTTTTGGAPALLPLALAVAAFYLLG